MPRDSTYPGMQSSCAYPGMQVVFFSITRVLEYCFSSKVPIDKPGARTRSTPRPGRLAVLVPAPELKPGFPGSFDESPGHLNFALEIGARAIGARASAAVYRRALHLKVGAGHMIGRPHGPHRRLLPPAAAKAPRPRQLLTPTAMCQ